MASVVPVNLVSHGDKFMQMCIIPEHLFDRSDLTVKDYVLIQTSEKDYICQVHKIKLPLNCIFVDDIVTANIGTRKSWHFESAKIPDSILPIKPSSFDGIKVKIVLKDNVDVILSDKAMYEAILHKLLIRYVIKKNCIINCNGLKLADFLHISNILISETFPESHEYGNLNKKRKVELIDMLSNEQIKYIEEFQQIQLGGISDAINMLKLKLSESSPILVTGPFGCGKSSVVKSFCSNSKYFFFFIDGLKIKHLTVERCQFIIKKFSSYLKLFPNRTCILFIDHIDAMADYDLKQKSVKFASLLEILINGLKGLNVLVIAAAVQRSNINPKVSSFFTSEVNLGMPSFQQREEILKCLTKSLACDVVYSKITQMTPGFVAHDLNLLVEEAKNVNKKTNAQETKLTIEDFQKALVSISPSILKTSRWCMKVKPVYWKDIGGMSGIKQKLQMCIEWPLLNPEIFKKVDLPHPHGVLFFGPPGCCKTTLARGIATECKANFFAANPAQVYSPYVGESEKNIAELFYQARLSSPSIIFLDELDSLVGKRELDKKSHGIGEKILSMLLNEMDGFGTKVSFQNNLNMQKLLNDDVFENPNENTVTTELHSNDVIVVAATNRPDLIDDALLRPGRFDVILYVPPPNEEERESILNTLTREMPLQNVDLKSISENTHNFSGADLKSLCNEAAMNALRNDMSASYITTENFNEALKKVQPSITKEQIKMYEDLSMKYGPVVTKNMV